MCSREFQHWGSHTLTRRGGKILPLTSSSPLNFSKHGFVFHSGWCQLQLRPIRKWWRKWSEWNLNTLPLFALMNGTVVCSSCANPKYFQSNDSDDFLPMRKKKKINHKAKHTWGSPVPVCIALFSACDFWAAMHFHCFCLSLHFSKYRNSVESWNYL